MLKYEEQRRIYERSARLILLLALRDVCPGATVRIEHSIGYGVYMNVEGVSLTASLVRSIEARMHEIADKDLPITKVKITQMLSLNLGPMGNWLKFAMLLKLSNTGRFDCFCRKKFQSAFVSPMKVKM